MRTDYRIDDYQQSYFVIDSFEQLRRQTADVDFAPVYRRLEQLSVLTPDAILPADTLITHGTMAYAKR
jgi:phenylalanine-4-hydroxylase